MNSRDAVPSSSRSSTTARRRRRIVPACLFVATAVLVSALRFQDAAAANTAMSSSPPSNDNFFDATPIDLNALPFDDLVDMTQATIESGEPQYCSFSYQTVWYKFTPTTPGWLNLNVIGVSLPYAYFSVYRSTVPALGALTIVTCSSGSPSGVTFFAGQDSVSTQTYYVQVQAPCCGQSGTLRVRLASAPPPVPFAEFYYYPNNPSIFDLIQFSDSSDDPGRVGFGAYAWDFGDGTSATGQSVQHRYASDQDYNVLHTVTTLDGRSAQVRHVVSVRTHDVAITRFRVPNAASAGQNRSLSVGVRNTRYPETVRVSLYKGGVGGYPYYQQIGYLELSVPVRSSQTTDFDFSYTFTDDDANIGKVTFRALAEIMGARDVVSADNEAIALPTKVGKFGTTLPALETEDVVAMSLAVLGMTTSGTDLTVRLSLPRAESASLEVLDVSGRVVLRRGLSAPDAGIHVERATLDRRPAAGIYFVRLIQGRSVASKKVAIVP